MSLNCQSIHHPSPKWCFHQILVCEFWNQPCLRTKPGVLGVGGFWVSLISSLYGISSFFLNHTQSLTLQRLLLWCALPKSGETLSKVLVMSAIIFSNSSNLSLLVNQQLLRPFVNFTVLSAGFLSSTMMNLLDFLDITKYLILRKGEDHGPTRICLLI